MGNNSEIFIENDELIRDLQRFDLSKEEAEIYMCLLKYKVMKAREIDQSIEHIQRTNIYNFLEKLEKSEWVHINRASKPLTFNPYPPSEVLAKKLEEKRNTLLNQLEDINYLEEKTLPKLLDNLNAIHQENSLKQIPVEYKLILMDFFENNPSVRIEYTHNSQNINPWLNFFFVSCVFHGFFISWHKKPVSDEYSLHIYEFEQSVTETHLDIANKVLELQAADMITLLTEREGIEQMRAVEQESLKINGFKLIQETFAYKKGDNELEALIIHPWKLNKNTIAFFYSNKKENGLKLLEWIIKKIK